MPCKQTPFKTTNYVIVQKALHEHFSAQITLLITRVELLVAKENLWNMLMPYRANIAMPSLESNDRE